MIDFVEYVVAELKSKRLSKKNAVALVKQFSRGSSRPGAASLIHPLLHRNTSDLSQQRYSTTFTGEEFFLQDHQLVLPGKAAQKVLPAVVYLEMARVAVEQAWPDRPDSTLLELRDTVWAQPIIVDEPREVSIGLWLNEHDQIEFEIYTGQGEQEVVHCQGRGLWTGDTAPIKLDLQPLQARMSSGALEPEQVYAACASMGMVYGPRFQSIRALRYGSLELAAQLSLPAGAEDNYVLHPSLLDGALQSAVAFIQDESQASRPRLPFALESLRVLAGSRPAMVAWVRYAAGTQAGDKVLKLDIDLCDEQGMVCLQMRGLSSLTLDAGPVGSLLAIPVWQASPLAVSPVEYMHHSVVLCELSQVDSEQLQWLLPGSETVASPVDLESSVAARYSEYALRCFARVQAILRNQPQGKVLVQIVVPESQDGMLFAGLSGFLKTAALENPQLLGQLILVRPQINAQELAGCLNAEKEGGCPGLIRYVAGSREVQGWQQVALDKTEPLSPFKDHGVYLITGGLGGLGILFAQEILSRTSRARVVLTGRGSWSAENEHRFKKLSPTADRVAYRQVNLDVLKEVEELITSLNDEYGGLTGILHCAGMIADNFIVKKQESEFMDVLRPKVTGTYNLDLASSEQVLDFFVLFSSMTSAMGNPGQSDYAAANGFMDRFAAYRNSSVAAGERYGRTVSIHWPLWQAGGMQVDVSTRNLLRQTTGMQPMQTATGLEAFCRILALPQDQILVAEGDLVQIHRALLGNLSAPPQPHAAPPLVIGEAEKGRLSEETQEYLRRQLSASLKLPLHKIDARAALENYGIDSIQAMKLTNQLEETFGPLPKTLFFEYQTLHELSVYFLAQHAARLRQLFAPHATSAPSVIAEPAGSMPVRSTGRMRAARRPSELVAPAKENDAIAIIGLSGRYPEAFDIDAYWRNLREGKDCIIEVPRERWDWRAYFSADRAQSGHHYSKWGGFIAGVDEFDPLFFNISPREAEIIDPQERLFLQHAWMAIEDAGYTRAGLQVPHEQDLAGQVGVYVGVMFSEYQLFGAEASLQGRRIGLSGSAASIANRVSYALNLHGPSLTLDTMCSSSLTAIHLACQDLKRRRTSVAIAGGVNVSIHPNKYLLLSAGQFISSDGHCQSFGEGGDGYIPGEGVGVVILKRLSEAQRDGDHIYGIIRGTAINHGGKTNGYTVPNPQAQSSVIRLALAESGVDARHISYVEAHGTGTKLGDPIEIAALSRVFRDYTDEKQFCLIGSVKSNIGHCESAAGIAGLTKVLLQMRHRQIVPSLHSAALNPNIDFGQSPFVVNQTLCDWEEPVVDGRRLPRIAGLSSFGAGGSNAHMIVEEYLSPAKTKSGGNGQVIVPLSARSERQLRQRAQDLREFLINHASTVDLEEVAYTLQVGREPMEERLGLLAGSVDQLVEKLQAYAAGEQEIEDTYWGDARRSKETFSLFNNDVDLQQTVEKWMANKKPSRLLELWVKGLDLDWSKLYGPSRPLRRISLPTYPFARERYWIETSVNRTTAPAAAATAVLHPLLHRNTSDLSEQRYDTTLTGDEFFLADHQVVMKGEAERKVLPAVAYLEMARAAIDLASPGRAQSAVLELCDTVWAQPIVVNEPCQVNIGLWTNDRQQIEYEIYSRDGEQEIVHNQGWGFWSSDALPARLDLEQIRTRMTLGTIEPGRIYAACAAIGLMYGPCFQTICAMDRGPGEVLAQLRLPSGAGDKSEAYILHPSLLDGALQAAVGLVDAGPGELRLPFALERLRIVAPCKTEMMAWVRYAPANQPNSAIIKLDIDLCDEQGNVCVEVRGFSSRLVNPVATPREEAVGTLLATPVWQASHLQVNQIEFSEHQLFLFDLEQVDLGLLNELLPQSNSVLLRVDGGKNLAERYSECALECFVLLQTLLRSQSDHRILVQVVVPDHAEGIVFTGLSALLKTASLENPRLLTQLIMMSPECGTAELVEHLRAEKENGQPGVFRYTTGARELLRWQKVDVNPEKRRFLFRENGVYVITGGLGGLGVLFAQEILRQTNAAHVVLTGRSTLTAEKQVLLEQLSQQAGRLSYRQVDLCALQDLQRFVASIQQEYGQIHGILHSAGMIADNFIVKKSAVEFSQVLAPKVTGTYNLDLATRDQDLDFLVLFSSVASASGNPGQADYASANAFMDQFAAYRNSLAAAGERRGRSLSIQWPLWQAGGMKVDPLSQELLEQTTGMRPMRTATGLEAFYHSLALPHDQILVAEGNLSKLSALLLSDAAVSSPAPGAVVVGEKERARLREQMEEYLRKQFSPLLKLPAHQIDAAVSMENYGIDSILAMKLTSQLEKTFGPLSKTLFFEHQSIAGLAAFLVKAYPPLGREISGAAPRTGGGDATEMPIERPVRRSKHRFLGTGTHYSKDVAIVGLAGRYPQANNLDEFWANLQSGRDCITTIPSERWDGELYYDAERSKPGKSYTKWGGFIDDVDKFDPLFFNISPREAELLDPQERLFLETAWQTIEDAGYPRETLAGKRIGVYVGVMWGHYELFGAAPMASGAAAIPSSSYASIANRVSYFFDFHGPSIALDTMCSSSMTAIHLACEEIRSGRIEAAIAGGVNLTLHPNKYLNLSQGGFVSSDGKCRSFGAGGDGYVPGEGVGAVLLKPLEAALRDRDRIYAVVKSSTINHGGKTNGYTVPNPNAQADLILQAFESADIDPTTLSYVETHGTGTSLGDPIEIAGLAKAFAPFTEKKQFCPIGSVKSNIGHLEAAAGIAALTKALLQIKNDQLVPSLHSSPPNPNIDLKNSPFYVQTELTSWVRPGDHPRRVGVSSFGAGGSNAHLLLEEYADSPEPDRAPLANAPELFVLSARDLEGLHRYVDKFITFLADMPEASLGNIAYTSQLARTPMDARLAIVASSVQDLRQKLSHWASDNSGHSDEVFHGSAKEAQRVPGSLVPLMKGMAARTLTEALLENRDLAKLGHLWTVGVDIPWSLLPRVGNPKRISLPTYPFAKERYWVHYSPVSAPAALKSEKLPALEQKRPAYYRPRWVQKPLNAQLETFAVRGPVLLFAGSEEIFSTLKTRAENTTSLTWVKPGSAFLRPAQDIWTIDSEQPESFDELIETLEKEGQIPEAVILHCSSVPDLEVRQDVAQGLNESLYLLFHFLKSFMKNRPDGALKILSVFLSPPGAGNPLLAALGGFFKTLTLESPRYVARVIDVDASAPPSQQAGLIWDELGQQGSAATDEVRYQFAAVGRKPERYISELLPLTITKTQSVRLPLRKHGVYLISGGLGGLGLVFAEYLAVTFQARLVLVGRSAPNARQQAQMARLQDLGAQVLCLQADVSRLEDVESIVRQTKAQFADLNGVIHAAGVNRDAFLLRKTREEVETVIAPKLYGALNLDKATIDEGLDLFVLFSSIAAVMGNIGQSDYAYANHFLDSFAAWRDNLVKTRKRNGRTLSINWPLWDEGGMSISPQDAALLEKRTGLSPLPTLEGIQCWEDCLLSESSQVAVLYGVPSRIAAHITPKSTPVKKRPLPLVEDGNVGALVARTEAWLKEIIGEGIKLSPDRIDSFDRLDSLGIDSVLINQFNARLETDLGSLPKTLLYEHETIHDLAGFLLRESRQALLSLFSIASPTIEQETPDVQPESSAEETHLAAAGALNEPIAIIGLHGNYPHSIDLAAYWENLKQGKNLIDLIPPSRWDHEEFYHPDPAAAAEGKIYCKWGGFLEDYDKFDPQFFSISPEEAKLIDPQERMFLQSVWAAIEDAGYTRDSLKRRFPKNRSADVGVFCGVTTNSYQMWGSDERSRGNVAHPSSLPWSIANRVSHFFDFNGPSMPVDTACSSSLVAIHLACESLRHSDCQIAIAGGVNLYLHPSKYQSLCQRRMLSPGGKCHSYGLGDGGFVPGEGVGSVVLKPLSKAVRDQDRIYAVIPGSAFDHSGRSTGYSAPNPNSQSHLISRALQKAGIHPESITYVEGHGTGTRLGDSLEVAAITQAFHKQTAKTQFCSLGSVKANMGHAESAAGMAGLAKVLLQLKHRQLAPSIYSDPPNPDIEFQSSPFYLQQELAEWKTPPGTPRRALINSFGVGGVSACVIVEEYENPSVAKDASGPGVFTLSARNETRLREYAHRLLLRLQQKPDLDLASLCYTLQVGREAMEERLAIVAANLHELIDRLAAWNKQGSPAGVCRGTVTSHPRARRTVEHAIKVAAPEPEVLAQRWVAGEDIDWESLYLAGAPRRVALPTYPFARERYWVTDGLTAKRTSNPQLHPLISYNSSTLREISFTSALSENDFYAVDHQINNERIFPGAGFLEIACIAGNIAAEKRVRCIKDVIWIQPLSFARGPQTLRTTIKHGDGNIEYVIASFDDETEPIVHAEGGLAFAGGCAGKVEAEERFSISSLRAQCAKSVRGAEYYNEFSKFGFAYGPSFQTVQELHVSDSYALSKLSVAEHLRGTFSQFILHPSMIDGVFQTAAALFTGSDSPTPHMPFSLDELTILHPVRHTCYAYVQFSDISRRHHAKFNIQLLNESGDVLLSFHNLFFRSLVPVPPTPRSLPTGLIIAR